MHFLNDNFLYVLKVHIWGQFLLVIPGKVGSCKFWSSHRLTHSSLLNTAIIIMDRLAHLGRKLVITLAWANLGANELINPHSIDNCWLPHLIEVTYLVALLDLNLLASLFLLGLEGWEVSTYTGAALNPTCILAPATKFYISVSNSRYKSAISTL